MIDCGKKVKEQMAAGDIGPNLRCEYYPCHFKGQNCSLCFCPFYPCHDAELGKMVPSKSGGMVWSCEACFFPHRSDVVRDFLRAVGEGELPDPHEERLMIKQSLETLHMKKAATVMVLGATSGAGKSMLTAGLCRHFSDLGYTVSPFKAQNMSLNSMVTPEGEEMARAQELQARAGRSTPSARMNPILLKPIKDYMSQVVVEGRPFKDMDVRQYYGAFAGTVGIEIVRRNLDILRKINDVVVIEGAGSPAEINMMHLDITNMRTAELAEATCVLIVNIEWGGGFAYAYGTLMLLPEEERDRFKGIVLTNLYGGRESLGEGISILEEDTGVPVIGVLPHLELQLPDEDSMFLGNGRKKTGAVRVAVVQLPRISNFTDFDALSLSGADISYVDRPDELRDADVIIIPGTKNTVMDLEWLRQKGLAEMILEKKGKVPIVGICGGYQMLGRTIDDSKSIEGGVPKIYDGLGLLPVSTSFDLYEKRTVQVTGHVINDVDSKVRGYEIHMGTTERSGTTPLFKVTDGISEHEEGSV
ncbi:MAG TPA: cobyric acid synthase, partial [Methanomassiliicoccales archaeon]|nr:cobyric acid synthase [Methanomassiliicoccales archaeon]